jgi:hypothetical protein
MHDSKRYRSSAAGCLMAAQDACRPGNRGIHLPRGYLSPGRLRRLTLLRRGIQFGGPSLVFLGHMFE